MVHRIGQGFALERADSRLGGGGIRGDAALCPGVTSILDTPRRAFYCRISSRYTPRAEHGKAAVVTPPNLQGNTCVVGLQWGDEGKGKIVDFLTEHADVVVRYCGGANAGHTVRIGGEKYATHLLPVGVFRPGVMNLVGNGVVLDPQVLFQEIDEITRRGIPVTPANLRVSYKAHVVMPYHKQEDVARESSAEGG